MPKKQAGQGDQPHIETTTNNANKPKDPLTTTQNQQEPVEPIKAQQKKGQNDDNDIKTSQKTEPQKDKPKIDIYDTKLGDGKDWFSIAMEALFYAMKISSIRMTGDDCLSFYAKSKGHEKGLLDAGFWLSAPRHALLDDTGLSTLGKRIVERKVISGMQEDIGKVLGFTGKEADAIKSVGKGIKSVGAEIAYDVKEGIKQIASDIKADLKHGAKEINDNIIKPIEKKLDAVDKKLDAVEKKIDATVDKVLAVPGTALNKAVDIVKTVGGKIQDSVEYSKASYEMKAKTDEMSKTLDKVTNTYQEIGKQYNEFINPSTSPERKNEIKENMPKMHEDLAKDYKKINKQYNELVRLSDKHGMEDKLKVTEDKSAGFSEAKKEAEGKMLAIEPHCLEKRENQLNELSNTGQDLKGKENKGENTQGNVKMLALDTSSVEQDKKFNQDLDSKDQQKAQAEANKKIEQDQKNKTDGTSNTKKLSNK